MMITSLRYDFGKIDVFDTYVLAVMDEGVTVKPEYNVELVKLSEQYFSGKSFGYITFRTNSYSVDPKVYIETSKIENLVAFAVVADNPLNISNIDVEKIFLTKPMKVFSNLDEAKNWVNQVVLNEPDDKRF